MSQAFTLQSDLGCLASPNASIVMATPTNARSVQACRANSPLNNTGLLPVSLASDRRLSTPAAQAARVALPGFPHKSGKPSL